MISPDELKQEVRRWADKIGVMPHEIHVRQMRRKWASCSSKGRITINLDILVESKGFIDEAIVHELLHLKYPNHGRMFKMMLRTYLAG